MKADAVTYLTRADGFPADGIHRPAQYIAKTLGRPSFIVLALGTILLVSFASMVYEIASNEADWSTHALC